MDPRAYVSSYLERLYLDSHPGLTAAARELVHEDIPARPEKYATTPHAQALVAYLGAHEELMRSLRKIEDIPDDSEFDRRRCELFDRMLPTFAEIARVDQLCVDARLMCLLTSDISVDACLHELLKLEREVHEMLADVVPGFSDGARYYWRAEALCAQTAKLEEAEGIDRAGADSPEDLTYCAAAELTASDPTLIGWLHVLEALAQLCLASARYRAAERYARQVLRAAGYPSHAEGTVLLALARLEDEEGFFAFAHELENHPGGITDVALEDSPWYLLGRTLLLYKLDRRKPAQRALRDFTRRCDGGAFFLLNPTYLAPYLPVRPRPSRSWDLAHQAAWDADGIIADTPDFSAWAESVEGVVEASENFASRNGF